jgi:hypothetical protein
MTTESAPKGPRVFTVRKCVEEGSFAVNVFWKVVSSPEDQEVRGGGELVEVIEKSAYSAMLKIVKQQRDALENAVEHTSSNLEDMVHYFDNKCVPTVDEVNQVAIADSELRMTIAVTAEALRSLGVDI